MTLPACIGEPISWPRLETFAAGRADPAIATHLAACPACQHCLTEITGDLVALPVLVVPARPVRRWWRSLVPAMALAATAIVAIVVWRARSGPEREGMVGVKGVGEVVVDVVRERAGTIRDDVRSFAPGDRWKIVVTCPPAASATFAVGVIEDGAHTADHPLAPARLACGNRVVLPGAFTLTGARANHVCVAVTSEGGDTGTTCVTITPE